MTGDNKKLLELQEDYINGRTAALGEMYLILNTIALKMVNAQTNINPKIKNMGIIERQAKAQDAATYVIEQYLKRPNFRIKESITAYLFLRVRKELYYSRFCDRMLVFKDVPEDMEKVKYLFIQTNPDGQNKTFDTLPELLEENKGLSKKKLIECIQTGNSWKEITFELLEI